ncbi:MAG: Rpn family recombination-promoting nuclease/putative transposase [Sulfuricellaceae bacterium]
MTDAKLLDPKNDFVFKKLFATAPNLLTALINAIRSEEDPIDVIEVLNPRIDPEELAGKFIVLDLLAQDTHGRRYNIEMQVRRYNAWSARSAYYLARTLTHQLSNGEDYQSIKPVIGIHLLDFVLFNAPDQEQQALWCFELRDRRQPDIKLGNELQLNIIELPKADRLGMAQAGLAAWVAFFEHWQEERKMTEIAYPPVQQALDRIKYLSGDAETRRLAFVRERALHDEISELRAEREKGKLEGKLEIARNLKASGIADEVIMCATGLSREEIDELKP